MDCTRRTSCASAEGAAGNDSPVSLPVSGKHKPRPYFLRALGAGCNRLGRAGSLRTAGAATTRYWNAIDIVPHVWEATDIAEIPDLYAPGIPPDVLVQALAATARGISLIGGYTQIKPVPGLPGTVNPTLINPAIPDFNNYFNQLTYQHVDAYPIVLGVPKIGRVWSAVAASHQVVAPGARVAALRVALQRKLLLGASGIARTP